MKISHRYLFFLFATLYMTASWAYHQDYLIQPLYLRNAVLINNGSDEIGGGKSNILPSLLVPGLGLARVTKKPIMLAFAPVCYGLVGYGTLNVIRGKSEYNNYMEAKNPLDQNTYYESAVTKNENGLRLLGIGTALWIIQAGWTFIYGSYNDIYKARNNGWNDKISFRYGNFDPLTKTISVSTVIKL